MKPVKTKEHLTSGVVHGILETRTWIQAQLNNEMAGHTLNHQKKNNSFLLKRHDFEGYGAWQNRPITNTHKV